MEEYELLGIRSTFEKAQELVEEHFAETRIGGKRLLRWDDHGAYYFLNGRRRDAGFLIEKHTVI